MQSSKDLSDHETVTRINLEREMSRYNNPTIVSPYTHPVQMRRRVHKKRYSSLLVHCFRTLGFELVKSYGIEQLIF